MRDVATVTVTLVTFLSGCVFIVYRGYTGYVGTVVDSASGKPLSGVVVTVCMLDRFPGAHMNSCDATEWKKQTYTDKVGRFIIGSSHHLGVILPAPHMGPGPYDTNLRFELDGYTSVELDWWRDKKILSTKPLLVHLDREGTDSNSTVPADAVKGPPRG